MVNGHHFSIHPALILIMIKQPLLLKKNTMTHLLPWDEFDHNPFKGFDFAGCTSMKQTWQTKMHDYALSPTRRKTRFQTFGLVI